MKREGGGGEGGIEVVYILWRRGHEEERHNGGICNGDIGARKKIIEVAAMLLSLRLFGSKFLVDEGFFHFFNFLLR